MSIAEVWVRCDTCQGTGKYPINEGNDCIYCNGIGKRSIFVLDTDLINKLNDILDKCNDIFEKVSKQL